MGGFPTLDEAGINDPHLRQDWLHVGRFELSLTDRANLLFLGRELARRFTKRSFDLLNERDSRGTLKALHLIILPDAEVASYVDRALGAELSCGKLDIDTYWELVQELCAAHWKAAHLAQRIELARNAGLSLKVILSDEMPEDVHDMIFQDNFDP